jgi:hypothetical protein
MEEITTDLVETLAPTSGGNLKNFVATTAAVTIGFLGSFVVVKFLAKRKAGKTEVVDPTPTV